MIDYPVIFEIEFLQEFQERFGKYHGIVYCLLYQVYLDHGWEGMKPLLPHTSAWRVRNALTDAGYIGGQ